MLPDVVHGAEGAVVVRRALKVAFEVVVLRAGAEEEEEEEE